MPALLAFPARFRSAPTLAEKKTFSHNIYHITADELGKVVQILDQRCDSCIRKVRRRGGFTIALPRRRIRDCECWNGQPAPDATIAIPPAFSQIDSDDIEIDIDAISAETFWEVDAYVQNVIATSKSKGAKRSR